MPLLMALAATPTYANTVWQAASQYQTGEIVTWQDQRYLATYATQGIEPQPNQWHWDGWLSLSQQNVDGFEPGMRYEYGDVVVDGGTLYVAKWQTNGQIPGQALVWQQLGPWLADDLFNVPEPAFADPKSAEAIHGIDANADGVRDSYYAAVHQAYPSGNHVQFAVAAAWYYKLLHALYLEEHTLPAEDAERLFTSFISLHDCAKKAFTPYRDARAPISHFANTLDRALAYRFGQNRLVTATGQNIMDFVYALDEQACRDFLPQPEQSLGLSHSN